MGAVVAVQAKYERTNDPKRMMTHALLNEAIRTDFDAIRGFLPARTATSIRYDQDATKAVAWDEGAKETKIDLPLTNGWYRTDGNPFAIPNGRESNKQDADALYLCRHQDRAFSGPLWRGDGGFDDYTWRGVVAGGGWSNASGVALIGLEATTPLVETPAEKLDISNPAALVRRAELLEAAAKELVGLLGASLTPDMHARLIKPTLDEATFLRELAGSPQPKA